MSKRYINTREKKRKEKEKKSLFLHVTFKCYIKTMVDFTKETFTRSNDRPCSYDSNTTDEGYQTDDKQEHASFDAEIPILKSHRTMYVLSLSLSTLTHAN